MAKPYDLFIRYLVTKGYDDIHEVDARLKELKLPSISQKEFDVQYEMVTEAVPGGILSQIDNKTYGSDFFGWMKELGVEELWYEDKRYRNQRYSPIIKLVYDIHQDQMLRLTINSLLIKNMNRADLAESLMGKFSTLLREEHILLYEKFFFNPARMSRTDWKRFLSVHEDEELSIYFTALTEDLETLKGELELPAKVNVSQMLQFHLAACHRKAKIFMKMDTPEAGREARAWITQLVMLTDKFEKYRSGDTDDFANAIQMEFDFIETDFPTPEANVLSEIKAQADPSKKQAENRDSGKMGAAGDTEGDGSKPEKEPLDLSSL